MPGVDPWLRLQGLWIDASGSKYGIVSDGPHHTSGTVTTLRPDGEKRVTKGLVKLGVDGSITWGVKYVLDDAHTSEAFVKWLPWNGGRPFVWRKMLHMLQGEWMGMSSQDGSKYSLTLDEPDRQSCSIATHRRDGSQQVSKGLIREVSAKGSTDIMWGSSFVLDVQSASDTLLRWLSPSSNAQYEWRRFATSPAQLKPDRNPQDCNISPTSEATPRGTGKGNLVKLQNRPSVPSANHDRKKDIEAASISPEEPLKRTVSAPAATKPASRLWADMGEEEELESMVDQVEQDASSTQGQRWSRQNDGPLGNFEDYKPVDHAPVPISLLQKHLAAEHGLPVVPPPPLPESIARAVGVPVSEAAADSVNLHLCVFQDDRYGFEHLRAVQQLGVLQEICCKGFTVANNRSAQVATSVFVGADALHIQGASQGQWSIGVNRPGVTWELDNKVRDTPAQKRRILLQRFADLLRHGPSQSIALVVNSFTTDADYRVLKELGRNTEPHTERIYLIVSGACGFDGDGDGDRSFSKAIVDICTVILGRTRVIQVALSIDQANTCPTTWKACSASYLSESARLVAYLSAEFNQGLLSDVSAGAEKWHSLAEVAGGCTGMQFINKVAATLPGVDFFTETGIFTKPDRKKDKAAVKIDACYSCSSKSVLECPVCSNWCCEAHWHVATMPQRCDACWTSRCYVYMCAHNAVASKTPAGGLNVCSCTRRACDSHFEDSTNLCTLCHSREGGRSGRQMPEEPQMPPPAPPPPSASSRFKEPQMPPPAPPSAEQIAEDRELEKQIQIAIALSRAEEQKKKQSAPQTAKDRLSEQQTQIAIALSKAEAQPSERRPLRSNEKASIFSQANELGEAEEEQAEASGNEQELAYSMDSKPSGSQLIQRSKKEAGRQVKEVPKVKEAPKVKEVQKPVREKVLKKHKSKADDKLLDEARWSNIWKTNICGLQVPVLGLILFVALLMGVLLIFLFTYNPPGQDQRLPASGFKRKRTRTPGGGWA